MKRFAVAAALSCFVLPVLAETGSDADLAWTAGVSNMELKAVDDSQMTLSPMEGRIVLEFTPRGGTAQKTFFSFMSDKMGTIAEDEGSTRPSGFFRLSDVGLEMQYEDGRTASLFANVAGGLTMTRQGTNGQSVCVSWFPKEHVFSAAERQAAVAAYAQSLGIAQHAERKGRHRKPAPAVASICSPAIKAPPPRSAPARRAETPAPPPPPVASAAPASAPPGAGAAPVAAPTVPVTTSPATAAPPTPQVVAMGSGASQCLSVEIEGAYVGFRNRCGNDVQFAYCVEKGSDSASTCGTGSKSGSVSGGGFAGLVAGGTAVEQDIRWVGCSGAPGEVAPQLDNADHPAGKCVKRIP
ncbi:MAG: hypothetical protein JO261_15260 [Alphaproteobacteria bacterium]|nr:hypothetical protein [Alphaproteobacteria bacterium]MBV9695055.1 hypothetical protein [Alphaproteobacteria bacterium]